MNIKGNRIISEKNVFRRIAALLTTLLLVITVIPEGFSTAITSVAEAADTAVTGAYFDTDGMKIVTYNVVNDFGADNTGNAMTGKQIQQALDAAQENSGQGIFTKVVIHGSCPGRIYSGDPGKACGCGNHPRGGDRTDQ